MNEDYGSFVPTPEVQAKVNELLAPPRLNRTASAILTHWVADNIRYAGISMGPGEGYTLHNAQMNFTDRCGVCKDKAGMLVAMLRAAGFKAYAAMTMAHERIDRIPADQFNHSVCAVQHRDGRFEMLDPTWVPNVRELWSSAEQQQGYLIGLPEGADLMYTPLSSPANHYVRINANTAIDQDGTLTGTITITAEGQSDRAVRGVFNARTAEWMRNMEMELLKIAPAAVVTKINHTDNDKYLEQPVTISYHFTIPDYAVVDKNTLIFTPLSARNFYSRAMSHLRFDVTAPRPALSPLPTLARAWWKSKRPSPCPQNTSSCISPRSTEFPTWPPASAASTGWRATPSPLPKARCLANECMMPPTGPASASALPTSNSWPPLPSSSPNKHYCNYF